MGEHRIFGGSVERFDSQVLLEPAEEEFHLPATPIQLGHGNGWDREVVGQKGKALARFRIDELDQAQFVWIIPVCVEVDEKDGLVATEAVAAVHRPV